MNIEIQNKNKNQLLFREEITATLNFDKVTPSNKDVAKLVADNLKSSEDKVAVKHIHTSFGDRKANVLAYVYDSKEKKTEIEPKKKVKKEKKEGDAPAEGAKPAPEAKKDDAPKDAPKDKK